MEKLRSETIAIPNGLLQTILDNSEKIRSVKAFCLVLSQIYWGSCENDIFDDYQTSTATLEFETIAEALGCTNNKSFKSEVKRYYREMNKEFFGDDSKNYYFHYEGYSKDKKKAIFKITKSPELYNLGKKGNFTKFSIQDILNCQNLYNFEILVFISTAKFKNRIGVNKITFNTVFLKYCIFGMDLYKSCYINKRHPRYNKYFLDCIEYIYSQKLDKEINEQEFRDELQRLAFSQGFESIKKMIKTFDEIVTFNKRKMVEDILEDSLKIINKGNRFEILENSKTKLHFEKKHKKGWKVEEYEIHVIVKNS